MKPLIIGMGPCRSHPLDPWHPEAWSTLKLCRLITGIESDLTSVERRFGLCDLNSQWHWNENTGDYVQPDEAAMTVKSLIVSGALRSGRKVIFLGEQVTNFMFASLRRPDSVVGDNAWRIVSKCANYPLRADDKDARVGGATGFYDFLAMPVWHPRILDDEKVRMPPGWQQQMMNALRNAGGLPPMRFSAPCPRLAAAEKRGPDGRLFPAW